MNMNTTITSQFPASFKGDHCIDCGVPISIYSRGRCRKCGYACMKRHVPQEFEAILRKLGSQGAARHFHASLSTVTAWRREIGMRHQERARRPSMGTAIRSKAFSQRPLMIVRDFTTAGQAADYLRKFGSVYRCNADAKPNAKGSYWRRNLSVLTDEQIIATARRLGWKGETW